MDERDLEQRLREAAGGVVATPDLGAVERGAARIRSRRRWATTVAAAMLVAGAGGVGFGLGRSVGDGDAANSPGDPVDPPATVVATTTNTPPPTAAPEPPAATESPVPTDAPAATAAPAGTAPANGDTVGVAVDVPPGYSPIDPYDLIYTRTLPDGTRLRALFGQSEWYGPDVGWGVGDWQPAAWCNPVGDLRVTVDGTDIVDFAGFGYYATVNPATRAAAQTGAVGQVDGRPMRLVVVQVGDDITAVAVRWDDGATDAADVSNGVAVLATPGYDVWTMGYELDLTSATGTATVTSAQAQPYGNEPGWVEACQPPPPELPAAGEPPADPAAAWAAIEGAMDVLWNGELPDDQRLTVLDDPTGVAEALAALRDGAYAETASTAEFIIEEHTFTSPTEAWFRYRIDTDVADFSERYGIATLVDGQWVLARAMFCADISLAGARCSPPAIPIHPPSFYDRYETFGYSGCSDDTAIGCWHCEMAPNRHQCFDENGREVDPAVIGAIP